MGLGAGCHAIARGEIRPAKRAGDLAYRIPLSPQNAAPFEVVESADPETFFTAPKSDRAKDFLSKVLTH
jgi:hypothetical protein